MKKYLKRLVWRTEDELLNPLSHVFFFVALVFGLAFAFFPVVSGASQTVLYVLTKFSVGSTVSSVWGVCLVLLTLANTSMLIFRPRCMGGTVAAAGFMLWGYAAIIYSYGHFWLGLLGLAVPNLVFWGWYYFMVKDYHRNPPENVF